MSGRGRGRGGRGRGNSNNPPSAHNGLKSDNVWAQRSQKAAGGADDRLSDRVEKEQPVQQPSKFQDACAKIQESVKQYIEKHGLDVANVSDDEDDDTSALDRSAILDSLLHQFDVTGRGDAIGDEHLGRTKQYLDDCLRGGDKIVCLICIESIRKTDEIWSCLSCYSGFHLSCIQKWAKDSVFMLGEALEGADKSQIKWCCPKCRKEYEQNQTPRHYACWCGKQRDPPNDPWLVPHSCGQSCKRALEPACGHKCNLLCHPGPCPPCPQMVRTKCHCGKSDAVPRRCSHKLWTCGSSCGRKLECGFHPCKAICHVGDCPPCPEKSLQACACGRSKAILRPCNDRIWHCDTPCGHQLSCGHHKCDKVCHAKGECGDCPLTGPRTCPCGKVKRVLPCTEDIGPCGDTCGKLLACGNHVCSSRCHRGNCGGCLQLSLKRCRCGAKEREVTCQKEYLCENKCKRVRDCKRHACNRKCCTGDCPPCEQPCGRTLGCKNHKCTSRCHAGPCYPCNATVDIKCFCGKTTRTVPCGRERNAKPPRCSALCKLPPNCHHEKRQPHKCHFGQCPPCNLRCGMSLQGCSHSCVSTCHDAVARKKAGKKAATPWEIVTPEIEIVQLPCPPCQAPIPVECFGKHEVSNLPCSEANIYSCSKPCGRLLACANHTCSLPCHVVGSTADGDNGDAAEVQDNPSGPAGPNCETCSRPCGKPRPTGCAHRCPLELKGTGCHPGSCPRCDKSVKLPCHCGVNGVFVKCYKWTKAGQADKDVLQSCQNACPKTMKCGHSCTLACHVGPCADEKTCKKKAHIRCACKRKKKEFPCTFVRENAGHLAQLVPCDEECAKRTTEKEKEAERKKKEEEEQRLKKEQEELEAFERKMKGAGRKRKQRAEVEEEEDVTWWKSAKGVAVVATSVSCVLVGIGLTWFS